MHWQLTSDQLPPLDRLVWLATPGKFVCLGMRCQTPAGWLWGIATSEPYLRDGRITAEIEFDDIQPVMWMGVPEFNFEK